MDEERAKVRAEIRSALLRRSQDVPSVKVRLPSIKALPVVEMNTSKPKPTQTSSMDTGLIELKSGGLSPRLRLTSSGRNNLGLSPRGTLPNATEAKPSSPFAPLSDEGLDDKEKAGAFFELSIYGMRTRAVFRNGSVWYEAETLCRKVAAGDPDELFSKWSAELCFKEAVVASYGSKSKEEEGEETSKKTHWLVSRTGLLKVIAFGTNDFAFQTLQSIAAGLQQFDRAEAIIYLAESARRNDILEQRRKRQQEVANEFQRWVKEKEEKKIARKAVKNQRHAGGQEPVSSMQPLRTLSEENALSAPARLEDPSKPSVRKLARAESEKKSLEAKKATEHLVAMKQKRLEQVLEGISSLMPPEKELPSDATEAVVDISASYLELDATRVIKVPAPTNVVLDEEQVFSGRNGTPAMSLLTKHFLREGKIDPRAARKIITKAAAILREEPNCIEVQAPCHIFGDIHGQLFDMINILKRAGHPTETKQLWLGDYVDRGAFGCEVALLLLAAKIKWPDCIFLLRGNHESRAQAKAYNFQREAVAKYGYNTFSDFMDCFDCLPLAAVVSSGHGRFFCVHGGLSPMIRSPLDFDRLERFEEPPFFGPVCDVLWSDPMESENIKDDRSKALFLEEYYADNLSRGCGQLFGPKAVEDFLVDNEMVAIVRAHECKKDGWAGERFFHEDRPVPMVFTVFSAPNYCGSYENKAAFLTITDMSQQISQLPWIDAPYALTNGHNAITFTLPFVAEAVLSVFLSVLDAISEDVCDLSEGSDYHNMSEDDKIAEAQFVEKVAALGHKVAKVRVERNELLRSISPLHKEEGEGSSEDVFKKVKEIDDRNERKRK